eukprot:1418984-Pleurochrysis_carterae.AAC.1
MGTGLTGKADAHKAAGDCNARGRALCCSRRQRSGNLRWGRVGSAVDGYGTEMAYCRRAR